MFSCTEEKRCREIFKEKKWETSIICIKNISIDTHDSEVD